MTASVSAQFLLDSAVELAIDLPALGSLENLFRSWTPLSGEPLHPRLYGFDSQCGPVNGDLALHGIELVFEHPACDAAILSLSLDSH